MNKNITDALKCICMLTVTLLLVQFYANAADTIHVVTHHKKTVVTNPSKGFNIYPAWGSFPSSNVPIRKIILKVKFGCPDSLRCADWDYKDHITLRRKGGVNGQSQDYELARMLTPYGGAFGKDWTFNWEVDVTDFSLLLRDSAEIEYNHIGYEPNTDRGWSVTLDFEIITGNPAWEPISIKKIYNDTYRYGDSSKGIENALKPVVFQTENNASFARLRVVQTGHGMDKPDGCGEFCSKFRELWYDGKLIDKKDIWKRCGNNPLYPQAGTWIYDRANWCPGNLMQPDIYDVSVSGAKSHTIDINMQSYIAQNPSADEVITAYLIQYKKAARANDIQLSEVITPSVKDKYRRQNPAVLEPQISVMNMGSGSLRNMVIHYGTKGFPKKSFRWNGNLASGAAAFISLPGTVDGKPGINEFEVALLKPNGREDGYPEDNKLVSLFNAAPVHDSLMVVYLQTNNQPEQNGYVIRNSDKQIVKQRIIGSLLQQTVYRDTIILADGKYEFELIDTAKNGLEFWANQKGGRGKLRLLNGNGQMVADFESDFGSNVFHAFEIGKTASPVLPITSIGLYPTRTNDKTTLDYYSNFPQDVRVLITSDPEGEIREEHHYSIITEGEFTYDLSRFPKSRYFLSVWVNGEEKFKKRVRLKE